MPFVPLKNRELPPATIAPGEAEIDTRAILTAAGEVAYEWVVASDALTFDRNVEAVIRLPGDRIATGRAFSGFLDPQIHASRQDVILGGKVTDDGFGVPYEVEYALLPDGPRGPRLIIEDVGRWYADGKGRPGRAHGVMRVINERHEREQRLKFLSRYDELTGYLNRTALLAALANALTAGAKTSGSFAFMVIAVDGFRAINEAYGFEVADLVFAVIAQRIRSSLRDGDAIGRFAGNKLAVVLKNCDVADLPAAADRFQSVARGEVVVTGGGSVVATVSIGGVSLPRYGKTVAEAVARAQEALHEARGGGEGRFAAFSLSAERNERRRANATVASELVAAFAENRFVLGYQPIVETGSRRLAFSEALIRMRRAESGEVAAADFVALAERLGLVRMLDERSLQLALTALERAPAAQLSLNVSGQTVGDREWLKAATARLKDRPGLAKRLIVEITETALVANADEAVRFVATLHDLGARVAIDDFGAGYSSFKHLRALKADIVKIDGAYVENLTRSPEDRAFVAALSTLARALGVKTVAERVQDEESAALLSAMGVDYLQGHLVGEAVTGERPPAP